MINLEDTEKLISQMRAQASSLNAAADALEASLAPARAMGELTQTMIKGQSDWFKLWGLNTNIKLKGE